MKKMFMIAIMMIGFSSFAQEKKISENRPQRSERGDVPQMEKFTPEQRKQLQLKKMTLALPGQGKTTYHKIESDILSDRQ